MLEKIKGKMKSNDVIAFTYETVMQFVFRHFFSDERVIKRTFKKRLGRLPNLESPIMFNDKLQWLKLNWRDPIAVKCADKFEVRRFVADRIGEEYLNELIGVWESVEEIDIGKLPDRFVLKATHGSGYNIICRDKSKMNWAVELKKLKRWLRTDYSLYGREWVYKGIRPRIICEKYLEEPNTGELRDYKIFCFNGEPKLIQVDMNRFINHKRNIYDLNWNLMDCTIHYPNDPTAKVERPKKLEEMLQLSAKLSSGFPHVRVDFYYVEDSIVFGELTFFHGNGTKRILPVDFEVEMGNWLKLPPL